MGKTLRNRYRHAREFLGSFPVVTHPSIKLFLSVLIPALWIFVFLAARYRFDRFRYNDYDVLPYARQFMNPDWLANDWYLNLKIGYRYAFNAIAGVLCGSFSFALANTIGRTIVAALMAVSFTALKKSLRIYALLIVPVLLVFSQHQSVVADESILLRFEAKNFAYGFAILSMAFLFTKRYRLMLGCLGAGLTFHVLVGIYAGFCSVCVIALEGEHRRNWKFLLKNSYILLATGFLGVYAVLSQVFSGSALDAEQAVRASNIYALMRVPHHVYPPAFGPIDIWGEELLFYCVPLVAALFLKRPALRQFSIYILSSLVLMAIGLLLYQLGLTHLLKYYWFRYPATMVPMGCVLSTAALVSLALRWTVTMARDFSPVTKSAGMAALAILGAALLGDNIGILIHPQMTTDPEFTEGPPMADILRTPVPMEMTHPIREWISNNTAKDEIFLVDPLMDSFYVVAERARVVSFKHSPQTEEDILEWYNRLLDISGLETIEQRGFACGPALRKGFCQLSETNIRDLAKKYHFKYVVRHRCSRQLDLPAVFRKRQYTIYSLKDI